jgi:predicted MFS family arabinose efflux permease
LRNDRELFQTTPSSRDGGSIRSMPITYRTLLSIRDMPALLLAATFSRLAARMFSLAIVLYALERFHSPALAGWLSFAALTPGLVVSPLAGALLDRIGPVAAIAVDMAISALLILAMVVTDMFGFANPAVLVTLVAAFSLSNPLSRAGVRTLMPRLVPPEALSVANALDTALYAVTDVIGPGVAGILVAFGGVSASLTVIALTFGGAAIATARIRRLSAPAPAKASLLRDAADGVALVLGQPTLRGLALSYSFYQVTWGVLVVAVPVLSIRLFPANEASEVTGFLWAASGIAGGIGALVTGRVHVIGRERGAMALGMIVTALACWPLAPAFGIVGLLLALMIVGAFTGPVDVGLLTLRQRRTDPAKLGRVLSVSMSLNVAGYPIGAALAGVLLTRSLDATFAVAAIASLLGTATTLMIPRDYAAVKNGVA